MNTRFHLQARKTKKPRRTIIAVVLAVIILVGVLGAKPPKFIRAALYGIASPVWGIRDDASNTSEGIFATFSSKKKLHDENQKLKDDLEDARLSLLDREAVQNENKELKEILGRDTERVLMLASVLSRPNVTPYDTLLIDVGSKDGVLEGGRVFSGDRLLLGVIKEVFGSVSTVELFSSPGVVTEVRLPDSELSTEASGKGGGTFEIELPKEVDVSNGDKVFSQGTDSYLVGIVGAIETKPADSFKKILIKSPVNLSSIRFLQVESASDKQ